MKRKRRKEWKKRIGKKTLKSIVIQDHEVRCSVVCIPFHEAQSKLTLTAFQETGAWGKQGRIQDNQKGGSEPLGIHV